VTEFVSRSRALFKIIEKTELCAYNFPNFHNMSSATCYHNEPSLLFPYIDCWTRQLRLTYSLPSWRYCSWCGLWIINHIPTFRYILSYLILCWLHREHRVQQFICCHVYIVFVSTGIPSRCVAMLGMVAYWQQRMFRLSVWQITAGLHIRSWFWGTDASMTHIFLTHDGLVYNRFH
jgi:hypothetical protein